MRRFWAELVHIELSHHKPRVLKELVIGCLVGLVLAGGLYGSPEWTLFAFILYLIIVQAAQFYGNDSFMTWRAWYRLGFRRPSLFYRVSYIIDYILRDMWVAEGMAVAVLIAGTATSGRLPWGLTVLAGWIANIWLLPLLESFAARMAPTGRNAYLAALMVFWAALGLTLFLGYRVPTDLKTWVPVIWLMSTLLYGLGIDIASRLVRFRGFEAHGARVVFGWIHKISVYWYKDILLSWVSLIGNLVMQVLLVVILVRVNTSGPTAAVIVFVFAMNNLFLGPVATPGQRQPALRLILRDPLFPDRALPRDAVFLRQAKLRSLLSGTVVSWFATISLFALFGLLTWNNVILSAIVLVTALVIEAPTLYQTGSLGRVLRMIVRMCLLIVFSVTQYTHQHEETLFAYCGALCAFYAPSLIQTYWFAPARVAAGAEAKAHDNAALIGANQGSQVSFEE